MISFFVPGKPQALKRHRTNKGRPYDASASDKADFLAKAMAHRPKTPWSGPLQLWVISIHPRPKYHYRSNGELGKKAVDKHTTRPDADNLLKFVCDALNGVFFGDDAQIWKAVVMKTYGDTPGVWVELWQEEQEPPHAQPQR